MKTRKDTRKDKKLQLSNQKYYEDFFKYLDIDPRDFDLFERDIDFDDYSR